jgi:hypothetical protein
VQYSHIEQGWLVFCGSPDEGITGGSGLSVHRLPLSWLLLFRHESWWWLEGH